MGYPSDNHRNTSRLFSLAYGIALVASLGSSWLTALYVRAGAMELNPVIRWIIRNAGLGGMVLARGAVLVAAYWCYVTLWRVGIGRPMLLLFAWLGAAVQVFDVVHNVWQALGAGWLPLSNSRSITVLVILVGFIGGLARPRIHDLPSNESHPSARL